MYYPCEDCYLKSGKQYSTDCDGKCDYARVAKELGILKGRNEQIRIKQKEVYAQLQGYLLALTDISHKKKGKVLILNLEDLKGFLKIIKKLEI